MERNHTEVFPIDLYELPPTRIVEFRIDLVPRTTPVDKAPYHLASSELNKLTIENRYPLPRIEDLFDQLQEQLTFRRLTYGQDITDKSQGRRHPKTTFRTRVCRLYLDKFVIIFIDDIFIYIRSMEEHEQHLNIILRFLKNEKLYAKFSKFEFWLREVQFLDHVVNTKGIHIEPAKIEAMKKWEKATMNLVTKLPRT
ncbi:putative nucleotidyltransferase, ribonuclease H [Tanacetum coccineum]